MLPEEASNLMIETYGFGPFDGGCLIVAKALLLVYPGSTLVSLVFKRDGEWIADHYGVKLADGRYADAYGIFPNAQAWKAAFSANENVTRKLKVYPGMAEGEAQDDPRMAKEVAQIIWRDTRVDQNPPKIQVRVQGEYDRIVVQLMAGRKRIGHTVGSRRLRFRECESDVDALRAQGFDTEEFWTIDNSNLEPAWQGQGLGKTMYRAFIAEAVRISGTVFIAPMECTLGSGTSRAARRVWAALASEYPSSGEVLFAGSEALAENPLLSPSRQTESEPGWLYHATNAERLEEIAQEGMVPHLPWEFTDQGAWPDGSTKKRIYFSEDAGVVWQFAPEEGQAVILRVPKAAVRWKQESTGDVYVRDKIPPDLIEALWDDGWRPL